MAGQVVDSGPRPTVTGGIRIRLRASARRRNLELVLLVGALVLSGAAIVLVQLGALGRLDGTVLGFDAALAVLVIAGHVSLRVVAPEADPFVFPIAVLLNGIGIAEI